MIETKRQSKKQSKRRRDTERSILGMKDTKEDTYVKSERLLFKGNGTSVIVNLC